jgi:hypothetical protein
MRWIAALALVLLPGPALADAAPPGGAAVTEEGRATMPAEFCAELAANPPADHVPGIDAEGEPVAPADLPSAEAPGLAGVAAEVTARLKHVPGAKAGRGGQVVVGYVTLRNGRAYLNGAPLDSQDVIAMVDACRAAAR